MIEGGVHSITEGNQENAFISCISGYTQASNKQQEKNSFEGGWQIL